MPELPPPPDAPQTLAPNFEIGAWLARLRTVWGGAAAAVAIAALAFVVASALRPPPPAPELTLPRADQPAGSSAASDPDAPHENDALGSAPVVHAAGAVVRPGVYKLRAGARVADLLDAAGGPIAEADLDALNLAAPLTDGERVYVARKGEVAPPVAGGDGTTGKQGPVNLNTATAEELDALPGVGPSTAQAILEFRKEHGRIRSVDELLEVRGIGEAKLAALRSKVRV